MRIAELRCHLFLCLNVHVCLCSPKVVECLYMSITELYDIYIYMM
jgi:hypothetical protein